jgi:ASC-1-like (ASCH) protein
MSIIKKKTWPEHFNLVKNGKKRIDIRLADFKIKEDDVLILQEWDPKNKRYTGRQLKKRVKYILKFKLNDFGQKEKIEKKGIYIIQF